MGLKVGLVGREGKPVKGFFIERLYAVMTISRGLAPISGACQVSIPN
jgi:hypothetical protein